MPTPFTHLAAAEEILARPELAPDVKADLQAELPAFLFGNTAPDVQTISGQPREATHFFRVPMQAGPRAELHMLSSHPILADRSALPAAQAAFLAGYLAHLVFDQLWIRDIFEPFFGEEPAWGSFRERLYLHNVLRADVDAQDLERLGPAVPHALQAAEPNGWLPFVDDHHLHAWRDIIADQLSSGAGRTVEVFAQRARIDPREFAALLASPQQMQQRVFSHLPSGLLAQYRAQSVAESTRMISAYWQGQPLPSELGLSQL
jgi:hypothetical protein